MCLSIAQKRHEGRPTPAHGTPGERRGSENLHYRPKRPAGGTAHIAFTSVYKRFIDIYHTILSYYNNLHDQNVLPASILYVGSPYRLNYIISVIYYFSANYCPFKTCAVLWCHSLMG